MANRLREGLENGEFVITAEMIPGRGARLEAQARKLEEATKLFATGRIHAMSFTDNPGGNSALSAGAFARDMLNRGITPLLHMSCKDRNRNMLCSALYSLERSGIENVLSMTGDYPTSGWKGMARPVFDIDPIQLIEMIMDMNKGLHVARSGETTPASDSPSEPPTNSTPAAWSAPSSITRANLSRSTSS